MSNIVIQQAEKLASTLSIAGSGSELIATLKATAFKGQVNDAQMTALLIVAQQYGLSPWTKEIYAFPDKNNGIVPVVGVDGWSRIINSNPQFDGIEFEHADDSCTCVIYRKDRNRPIKVTEYMDECKRGTGPWQSHPRRMLRHKAMIQCARLAFGYGGIYDQDEAERIVEASPPVKHTGQVEDAAPQFAYTPEQFAQLLPTWRAAISARKATANSVIGKIKTKGTMTAEQEAAIRAPIEPPAQQTDPVTDVHPKGEPEAMAEKTVGERMHHAATLDALFEAADLIGEVADPEARARLTAFFEERKFALEAS